MSTKTRHDRLMDAGWRYDETHDRYTPDTEGKAGTERWYNLAAAYALLPVTPEVAPEPEPQPTVRRQRDPRAQEPQ